MKSGNFWKWYLGVGLTLVPIAGICLAANSSPASTQTEPSRTTQAEAQPEPGSSPSMDVAGELEGVAGEPASTNDIAAAPVQVVSTEKPLPSNIRATGSVAELVKLANSGVEEGVMMAFVTNSPSTFNLSAEEIIYLKDIGVPDNVVTAMILRDQTLRNEPATALALATPAVPTQPESAPVAPGEVAPQPEGPEVNYAPEPAPAGPEVADDSAFYDSLAPYGSWAYLDGYGLCWQPTVVMLNSGWQPYYNCGRWVYTDCGWYWHSDYSWGWAPFHYGRWFRHHRLGWCWLPDRVWGPSWVSWRYTDGYCGWAPLPPGAFFSVGVGITFHGRHVAHWDDCGLRADHYRFVAWNHFHDRNFQHEHLSPEQHRRVFHESVVATRYTGDHQRVINNGLPPERVASATHTPIRKTVLHEVGGTPRGVGRTEQFDPANRTLTVYRPKLPQAGARPQHWSGTRPSASALSSQPAPSAPSAGVLAERYPANRGDWRSGRSARDEGRGSTRPGQNQPLILKGAQSSAARETAPPSSLVIIGRKDNPNTWSSARPAPSAQSAGREAWNSSSTATPWMQQNTSRPQTSQAWSQPQTRERQSTYTPWGHNSVTPSQSPAQTYRPAPTYQAPARSAPAEAPRVAPAPAQSAPRASSPPPSQAPARSAPAYPSQPNRGRR